MVISSPCKSQSRRKSAEQYQYENIRDTVATIGASPTELLLLLPLYDQNFTPEHHDSHYAHFHLSSYKHPFPDILELKDLTLRLSRTQQRMLNEATRIV